ncbi:50S ribosomal protein L13 [Candidatus Dependentiae bacterium]|nr:50S ribosomal protein L13 [Candidatus Dependentiae bacterium]
MNKSFVLRPEAYSKHDQAWHVIDASDQILGRLATRIADMLRGKDNPMFTPHSDSGVYVVVINCDKIKLTGDKLNSKMYATYSGWRSGLKEVAAKDKLAKDAGSLVTLAVRGMLPKNKLSRQLLKKLRVYAGNEHPHVAQLAA